ncbi:hypothetical protein Tsubulata_012111 [Turnera subulata]|uniref:Pectinesterase inhibitor domain-containing protein n=1 Tax=Turnera subulata TaxID=218843 RepID=A0A9Q0J6J3_9ROSI|nr:hypothetical protein Tsubulata_012111 [Turnera subulata]
MSGRQYCLSSGVQNVATLFFFLLLISSSSRAALDHELAGMNNGMMMMMTSSNSSSRSDEKEGNINDIIAAGRVVTEAVDEVCKQTRNYSFCVEALEGADGPVDEYTQLAFVSVRIAYLNATATHDLIRNNLMEKEQPQVVVLQSCYGCYGRAISILGLADNDLNSETYFELPYYSEEAAQAALDCQAALDGDPSPVLPHHLRPLLTRANSDFVALSQIIGVVGLFITGHL